MTITLILTILLNSCITSNELNLNFPEFPDPYNEEGIPIVSIEDNVVSMPLYYWLNIVDYANFTNEQERIYELWKSQ